MKFYGIEDPDGNIYEIETDETLEKEGIPADAAAVGKKTVIKEEVFYKTETANLCDEVYEYGYVKDDGENNDSLVPISVSFRTKNYIPVDAGRKLCFNTKIKTSTLRLAQYDSDKQFISIGNLKKESNKWTDSGIFLTAKTKYIRFGVYIEIEDLSAVEINLFYYEDREKFWNDPGDVVNYVPHHLKELIGSFVPLSAIQSPLTGKKIVYDGDSIAESRSNNGGGYAKLIADCVGCVYENQAVGGARLTSRPTDKDYHSVVDNLPNLPADGDLYCFEGGINDFWTPKELGTFDKKDFTGDVDTNTVCGALEKIFRYAINTFVGKPICFLITHKIQTTAYKSNPNGDTFEDYRNAMVGICEKYSVPYYDAFSESGLNGWNDAQNNAYLTANTNNAADGCHPNKEGYEKYYVPQLIDLFEKIMPRS